MILVVVVVVVVVALTYLSALAMMGMTDTCDEIACPPTNHHHHHHLIINIAASRGMTEGSRSIRPLGGHSFKHSNAPTYLHELDVVPPTLPTCHPFKHSNLATCMNLTSMSLSRWAAMKYRHTST